MPLVPSGRWPWTVCACFPVKVEHSATVMRLWKAWQCPLSPLGSPLSWRRTGQGPGHPHPSPEHSLHLMCVEPRRPLVGCRRECRLQGPRAARLPPEGAWRLLVAGHPDGHGAGWEQLPLSPRRGWWARTGRGPAPSAGKPRPSAEPTLGPRLGSQQHAEHCVMVTGVPNVGKSSLINSLRRQHLRKGKATRVGGEPGITRAVMSRIQVCERPLMFLLDTPGVLAPRIPSVETGLKLALCGTVLDHLVGEETLADYLLYTLNRHQLLGYVQHYGLGEACDDIASVLKRVAVKLRKTQKVKVLTGTGNVNVIQPDYPAAARDFLRAFRSGLLGPVMLDCDLLQGRSMEEEEP
uniref:Mitochondrial ribosome associated GTPase 1 n=1 Tax=Ovis aries TaxID=9940 RepID=A0AC11D6A0_SHEEP